MYTIEQIRQFRKQASSFQLDNWRILDKYTDNGELKKICNGIGAEFLPKPIRKLYDSLNPLLRVVAVIHDVEFHEGGTREQFKASNRRFETNGIKAAKATYGWYDPRRYWGIKQAKKFAAICDRFGWTAWNQQKGK